jgi:ankyrin repeat protein
LHYAARTGKADCCALLLQAGADVDLRDGYGLTVLDKAHLASSREALDFLMRYRALHGYGKRVCILL